MKNLDKSEIDSLKESGYTFEEIKHIDDALGEDDEMALSAEEVYRKLFLNRTEKNVPSKV